MSWLSSRAHGAARARNLLVPIGLWLLLASSVRADAAPVVIWLGGAGADGQARERALQLELDARGLVLLHADPPAPGGPATPAAPDAGGATDREAFARQTLMRTDADAVLWLEGDQSRPVSWLRVVHQRGDAVEQAPLPHPPEAIDPELFAIAAASLLEQVLRAPPAVGPGAEPPVVAPVQSATVAAVETAPPPAPVATPPPVAPAEELDRGTVSAPEPAPTSWFVQAGLALSLAHVSSGMEAATRPKLDEVLTTFDSGSFFDPASPWVPDGDSFDDFEATGVPRGRTPVPGNCPADGIATGPLDVESPDGELFEQLEPSSSCALVEEPGFALVPALRVVLGRWVLPRLALGVLYQGHFGIDASSFLGSQLFGVQGEYLALGVRGRGISLSLLAELTVGRTETPVPSPTSSRSVNALSGPFGAQAGALARLWPSAAFALFVSPGLGVRFPAGQLLVDLRAGAELPF